MWRIPTWFKVIIVPIPILLAIVFIFIHSESIAGEDIEEIAWPDFGKVFWSGDTNRTTSTTTLGLNSYVPLDLNLTENQDANNCFSVPVGKNEVCYSCTKTINAFLSFSFSADRTTGGSGNDILTYAFGKGATTTITDGDEIGDEYVQFFGNTTQAQIGHLTHATTLALGQCIAILGQIDNDDSSTNFDIEAATLSIIEH